MDKNNNEENLVKDKDYTELKELDNYEEKIEIKENGEENEEMNHENKDSNKDAKKNESDNYSESSESSGTVGKKMMKLILFNLNSYWIDLIATINLLVSLYIYEVLGIIIVVSMTDLIENKSIEGVYGLFDILVNKLGIKWLLILNVADHLSVGFFCLTTFSAIFEDTKEIKKFYIWSFIKVAIYYGFSIFILGTMIISSFRDFINDSVKNSDYSFPEGIKNEIIDLLNILIDELVIIIADFLSTYNVFLEKLVLGSLYIFLFFEPKKCANNKKLLIFFRCLSVIPISFIVVSLILRALLSNNKIKISEYILAFLMGPKISIYGFFIVTLSMIKYKTKKYNNIFDQDNSIDTKVFTKIGSTIFAIFGAIEFIIGLCYSEWTSIGIGRKYLILLCAPIFTLYDYKKKTKVTFPCCHKGDMSKCFRLTIYIVGYFTVIVVGIILIALGIAFISSYIAPILKFLVEGLDYIYKILNNILLIQAGLNSD